MRKFSLVLVAAMLLSAGNLVAKEVKPVDPDKSLSAQISQRLNDTSFTQNEMKVTAQIRFTLNNKGQIVVLTVDTEDPVVERFVKYRLNYYKVELDVYTEGKIYTIPIRIVG